LNNEERAVYSLRSLYKGYGYTQYKMSKFEEYDLYVKNKEFLVSDNVITFTDTDGKLMALKPDVTLSIIKSNKDLNSGIKKVFYNENVYRVSKGTHAFKEIMQVGLECLGDVDDYTVSEVLMLAVKSLQSISNNFVLDLSNLGIVSAMIEDLNISQAGKSKILACLGEKNTQGIEEVCVSEGVEIQKAQALKQLACIYGAPSNVFKVLDDMDLPEKAVYAKQKLVSAVKALESEGLADKVNIDFSVVNDMSYYNGIVFKGFISGIPTGVLSGGQYYLLMNKMGFDKKAIGFAVYLDALSKLGDKSEEYDVETVILYSEQTDMQKVLESAKKERENGKSVLVLKSMPEKFACKKVVDLTCGGN
jgi:ATP phosphoribosyltransferase regulatory subunit